MLEPASVDDVLALGALEDIDDVPAPLVSPLEEPEELAPDDGDESEDKYCPGCARHCTLGMCFIMLGAFIQWALPELRGLWCKDCFNLWRLVFKSTMKLTDLAAWFRDPAHRTEWNLALGAYI